MPPEFFSSTDEIDAEIAKCPADGPPHIYILKFSSAFFEVGTFGAGGAVGMANRETMTEAEELATQLANIISDSK